MKLIKLLLIILIFAGGVYVGNQYLPQTYDALAVVVSVPEADTRGADVSSYTFENTQKLVTQIKHLLTGNEELAKNLETSVLLLDYKARLARYEAEAAKNKPDTRATPQYAKAAAEFINAKKNLEKYFADMKAKEAELEAAAAAATQQPAAPPPAPEIISETPEHPLPQP